VGTLTGVGSAIGSAHLDEQTPPALGDVAGSVPPDGNTTAAKELSPISGELALRLLSDLYADLGGFVVVLARTDSSEDDGSVGVDLLGRLGAPVASFRADGAYDSRAVYAALDEVGMPGIDIAIPPRRTASSSGPSVGTWQQREAALLRIDEVGRRQWRKESGAHQQARAENGMGRFKQILGPRLRSRSENGQRREAMIGVNILNRMTDLGMPESEAMRN
jgi:hypothetical protein